MRAFVVTGEGAKGAWQAAAIGSLLRTEPLPDLLIGVSSGAVNAAALSLMGGEGLLDFWRSIRSIGDVFKFNGVSSLWREGLFNSGPARRRLEPLIGLPLSTPFSLPMIQGATGELVWYNSRNTFDRMAAEAVVSAISIPGMVEPNGLMFDGGVRTLAPIARAFEKGATDVTVIMARPMWSLPAFSGRGLAWKGRLFKAAAFGYRALDLLMHEIIMRDIGVCCGLHEKRATLRIVCPAVVVGDTLDFGRCGEMADLEKYPMQVIEMRF